MAPAGRHIVVIGTSAGGLAALDALAGSLPARLPASLFIVQHMTAENTGEELLDRLQRHAAFDCKLADDGEAFAPGRLYIARPNCHLLVKTRTLLVTKGARENRYRPAIDPLFRSAAVAHGPRVIGMLLTGLLDDGTAGLSAIGTCGGVTVVQDPRDAAYPAMPQAALTNLDIDHCIPIAEMGRLLETLVHERPRAAPRIPRHIRTEAEIAERVLSDVAKTNGLGSQVPYNCPNCGGVLWEMDAANGRRYRCHTGHSFTGAALLASQSEKIEETLWISLRMFEERKNLLNVLARRERRPLARRAYAERATDANVHIERIRKMLTADGPNHDPHGGAPRSTSSRPAARASRRRRSRA